MKSLYVRYAVMFTQVMRLQSNAQYVRHLRKSLKRLRARLLMQQFTRLAVLRA